MHIHSFDVAKAREIGLEATLIYQHIISSVRKVQSLNQNLFNQKNWASDTWESLSKEFPYFNENKIKTIFERLKHNQLIEYKPSKSNEAEIWYTVTDCLEYGRQKSKRQPKKTIKASNFHLKSIRTNWQKRIIWITDTSALLINFGRFGYTKTQKTGRY